MGTRGPVPKREGERNSHAKRAKDEETSVTKVTLQGEVPIPDPDPEWHPIARQLWDSLAESGQSRFYEPSDWAIAYSLMDDLSSYKSRTNRSGQMLATIMSSLSSLMVTEGDRRRLSLELNRNSGEADESDHKVEVMSKWRQKLG